MGRDPGFNHGKPLGVPALRTWDLNENSTRYDTVLAAPSDEVLRLMWVLFSSFFFLFAAIMVVVFVAIVTNKKIRANAFNLYLIFLMIPDIIFTILCAINCAWLAANGGFVYEWICNFQSFYLMYGIAANAWLNGIIAFEVHRMLIDSHAGKRYFPPPSRKVIRNALMAYLWAIFVGLWGIISLPWLPHETNTQHGITCTPIEYSTASTIFFWCVFVPAATLVPLLYALWATFDVMRRKLLPPTGRRRELAIYFFRIMFVFIIMWMPLLLLVFGAGGAVASPWVVWAGGLWGHMQGPVSAIVSCLKADIRKAVLDFLCCKKIEDEDEEDGSTRTTSTGGGRLLGRSGRPLMWYSPSAESMRWLDLGRRRRSDETTDTSKDNLEPDAENVVVDMSEVSRAEETTPPTKQEKQRRASRRPSTLEIDIFNANSSHFVVQ